MVRYLLWKTWRRLLNKNWTFKICEKRCHRCILVIAQQCLHFVFSLSVNLCPSYFLTKRNQMLPNTDLKLAGESAVTQTLSLGSPSLFVASAIFAVPRSVRGNAWADGICSSHLPLLCSAATGETLCPEDLDFNKILLSQRYHKIDNTVTSLIKTN